MFLFLAALVAGVVLVATRSSSSPPARSFVPTLDTCQPLLAALPASHVSAIQQLGRDSAASGDAPNVTNQKIMNYLIAHGFSREAACIQAGLAEQG